MISEFLLNMAKDKEGVDFQISLAQEECAELIVALAHYRRDRQYKQEEVVEEIADVTIMAKQMALIFGEEAVEQVINQKMERLASRLKGV